jgi:ribosome maturation factor RimP
VAGAATTGRVVAVDDEGVELDVDGQRLRAAWAELGTGRVQVEFSRPGADEPDEGDDEGDELDDATDEDEV